mgnify:CR=1 FL=1|tara:strand:- start:201 stop:1046 length:846 start_codon:yes stop_codon:yes gene_type:complete
MSYLKLVTIILSSTLFAACGTQEVKNEKDEITETATEVVEETPEFQNKGHELVYKMAQVTGDYEDLKNLKDVVYHYTYRTPDQKEDVSIESYIFDGELSHGKYIKHERTLADVEGSIEQGFNGSDFWIKIDGKLSSDSSAIEATTFTRKTNFYWFAMMQKLLDPGMNYEYLGQDSALGINYDVVKVTFESTDDTPTDTYQLYLNPETHLADQFLFTVVSKGVNDPILMRVTYEQFDGVQIPTYRKYTKSDWEANVIQDVWVEEISKDVKFNQGLEKSLFNK